MVPHSDKKGRLGDKFEDYSHVPSDEVWDRIAAQPSDKPLGAMFWAFTWMPKPKVWNRISAQLHPVAYGRIILWTSAAGIAAAVALILLFQFGAPSYTPDFTGRGLARSESRADSSMGHRPAGFIAGTNSNPAAAPTSTNGAASKTATPEPQRHRPSDNLMPMPVKSNAVTQVLNTGGDPRPSVADRRPLPESLDERRPRRIGDFPDDISHRTTFTVLAEMEQKAEQQRQNEREMYAAMYVSRRASPSWIAQAGTSLSTGAMAAENVSFERADVPMGIPSVGDLTIASIRYDTEENYLTPLVLGGSLQRAYPRGLLWGAGLAYTHMQSYLESKSETSTERLDITRQYLGLTSNVSYRFGLSRRLPTLAMFTTAGLQYDFGLGKRVDWRTETVGLASTRETEDVSLGGQANVNLAIGLRQKLFNRVSAFAQGSVARYFAQSETNLYSSKAFWPSFQAGLQVVLK